VDKHIQEKWQRYYGKMSQTVIKDVLYHFDQKFIRWAKRKYKSLTFLTQNPQLSAHEARVSRLVL